MRRAALKLGFIHRRLWARDPTYRMAFLAGPPPLIGMAVAAAVWSGYHGIARPPTQAAAGLPWAQRASVTPPTGGPPVLVLPDEPFPDGTMQGIPAGLTTGWSARAQPIALGAALDVDVLPTFLARFPIDRPVVELDRIVAAGPPGGLFVGGASAVLAIRRPGIYGLSIRTERGAGQTANCLQRLGFAHRRLVSNLSLNLHGPVRHDYDPVRFDLRPGLYGIAVVFGCWSGGSPVGSGALTVLIRHPGDPAPQPAGPDEILRPIALPPAPNPGALPDQVSSPER